MRRSAIREVQIKVHRKFLEALGDRLPVLGIESESAASSVILIRDSVVVEVPPAEGKVLAGAVLFIEVHT